LSGCQVSGRAFVCVWKWHYI